MLKVLLIEDNPADAKLFEVMLSQAGGSQFELKKVDRLSEGMQSLANAQFDVVLLDLSLPDTQGLETFSKLHCQSPETPIVVLSGLDDETLAFKAVQLGAQDYLVKGEIQGNLLVRSIRYAIERKKSEERIKLLNESLERRVLDLAAANKELDTLTHTLMLARDEALQASTFKSEFVARMSHEVRTPIAALIGMTELLAKTILDEEQQELIGLIGESADSLLSIVNEILDFSKAEAGKMDLNVCDFSPVTLVEGTAELVASVARKKGLNLMTFIDPEIPTLLCGDPVRLRQVLLNLTSNAIKFTNRGDVAIRVTLESEDADAVDLRFSLSDTGVGLSEAERSKLFRPYTQVGESMIRHHEGTGLGLSICKRIVELMKGQLGVESLPGKGSTFWFSVRLPRSAKKDEPVLSVPATDLLNGAKILTVSDNAAFRQIVQLYLSKAGMRPAQAASAQEALALLQTAAVREDPFLVVLVDLARSFAEALHLAEEIQQDPTVSSVRLVYLGQPDDQGKGAHIWKAGFCSYLRKPLKKLNLLATILELIGAPPAVEATAATEPLPKSSINSSSPTVCERGRILLAEDNAFLQLLLQKQLAKMGFNACIAGNGREAVEAALNEQFALVLMDCQMPVMDGLEATRAIRQAERTMNRHTPIIAMTAHVSRDEREQCLKAGMDEFIPKPVSLDDLDRLFKRWSGSACSP